MSLLDRLRLRLARRLAPIAAPTVHHIDVAIPEPEPEPACNHFRHALAAQELGDVILELQVARQDELPTVPELEAELVALQARYEATKPTTY